MMHQRVAHPPAGHRPDVEGQQPVVTGQPRHRIRPPHPRPAGHLHRHMLPRLIRQHLVRRDGEGGDAVAAVFMLGHLRPPERGTAGGVVLGGADHHRRDGPVHLVPRPPCLRRVDRPGVAAQGGVQGGADRLIHAGGDLVFAVVTAELAEIVRELGRLGDGACDALQGAQEPVPLLVHRRGEQGPQVGAGGEQGGVEAAGGGVPGLVERGERVADSREGLEVSRGAAGVLPPGARWRGVLLPRGRPARGGCAAARSGPW